MLDCANSLMEGLGKFLFSIFNEEYAAATSWISTTVFDTVAESYIFMNQHQLPIASCCARPSVQLFNCQTSYSLD
jgi:hypothetical protein